MFFTGLLTKGICQLCIERVSLIKEGAGFLWMCGGCFKQSTGEETMGKSKWSVVLFVEGVGLCEERCCFFEVSLLYREIAEGAQTGRFAQRIRERSVKFQGLLEKCVGVFFLEEGQLSEGV